MRVFAFGYDLSATHTPNMCITCDADSPGAFRRHARILISKCTAQRGIPQEQQQKQISELWRPEVFVGRVSCVCVCALDKHARKIYIWKCTRGCRAVSSAVVSATVSRSPPVYVSLSHSQSLPFSAPPVFAQHKHVCVYLEASRKYFVFPINNGMRIACVPPM